MCSRAYKDESCLHFDHRFGLSADYIEIETVARAFDFRK